MPRRKYTKGALAAKAAMIKRYGVKRGTAIFYAKANKYGKGRAPHTRANSIYTKGATRIRATRRRRR